MSDSTANLEKLLIKVKKHHHDRTHSKGTHAKHERIDWPQKEANENFFKIDSPKLIYDVPDSWLKTKREKDKLLNSLN